MAGQAYETRKLALIEEIWDVFSQDEARGLRALVSDNPAHSLGLLREAVQNEPDHYWREPEEIGEWNWEQGLENLDADRLQIYLPAFMTFMIRHIDLPGDSGVKQSPMFEGFFHLFQPGSLCTETDELWKDPIPKWVNLSVGEKQIIAKFLLHVAERDVMAGETFGLAAIEALDAYWGSYLKAGMGRREYEGRRLRLIHEVRAVFHGVSREGGVSVSECEVLDDLRIEETSHPLRCEARAKDIDQNWEEVPETALGGHLLCFLDQIGMRYYLPAHVVFHLKHMKLEPGPLGDGDGSDVLDALTPIEEKNNWDGTIMRRFTGEKRFSLLTPQQNRVIAEYLQLVADREAMPEIDQIMGQGRSYSTMRQTVKCLAGLKLYWGQFLKDGHEQC